jgi:cell wall-associated NlpC family hydrolase
MRAYSEIATFIGTPWVSGGRDAVRGCDCWGLIIAAARKCYGLELPDYAGYRDADELAETGPIFQRRAEWQRIAEGGEREGDVVVLRMAGTPAHAGLVVGVGLMLHSMKGRDACVERYRSTAWVNRLEGFYRWAPR